MYSSKAKRSRAKHGSGVLDHQPAPPNDSGIPLRHSHGIFKGSLVMMIVIKENPRKMSAGMLTVIIGVFLAVLTIIFVPFN